MRNNIWNNNLHYYFNHQDCKNWVAMAPFTFTLQFWSNYQVAPISIIRFIRDSVFKLTAFHGVVVNALGRLSRGRWFESHPRNFVFLTNMPSGSPKQPKFMCFSCHMAESIISSITSVHSCVQKEVSVHL